MCKPPLSSYPQTYIKAKALRAINSLKFLFHPTTGCNTKSDYLKPNFNPSYRCSYSGSSASASPQTSRHSPIDYTEFYHRSPRNCILPLLVRRNGNRTSLFSANEKDYQQSKFRTFSNFILARGPCISPPTNLESTFVFSWNEASPIPLGSIAYDHYPQYFSVFSTPLVLDLIRFTKSAMPVSVHNPCSFNYYPYPEATSCRLVEHDRPIP